MISGRLSNLIRVSGAVLFSPYLCFNPNSSILYPTSQFNSSFIRSAATVARYRRRHTYRKFRGLKFVDGSEVLTGDVLLTQNGLNFYSGENVRLNRYTWTLFAECDGRMVLSTERLSPYPQSPLFAAVRSGQHIERTFVHVVPHSVAPRFRLVSLV